MLVKKPVRTAKTSRAFPGQPAEERITPIRSTLLPQGTFVKLLKGELDPAKAQEIIAQLTGDATPAPEPIQARGRTAADVEAGIESKDFPQAFVIDEHHPEHVRVVIAKFAIEDLYQGSSMLVAGAKITNDGLVGFIRSLMTIANRRGLMCPL